jgi:hypothetical protein
MSSKFFLHDYTSPFLTPSYEVMPNRPTLKYIELGVLEPSAFKCDSMHILYPPPSQNMATAILPCLGHGLITVPNVSVWIFVPIIHIL